MIKAVFFDAIDTIFGAYPDKIGMYIRIIEEHTGMQVSRTKMTSVWEQLVKDTEEAAENESLKGNEYNQAWTDFNEKILLALEYNGDSKNKGSELHLEAWGNPKNFYLYKDVKPALEVLSKKEIIIGCVSNEDEYLNSFFKYFNIAKYFKFVVTSEEIGCEKPNAGIFNEALRISALTPDEVIFVGDSVISDYNGSKKVGMHPVLIDRECTIKDDNIVKISKLTDLEGLINA